MLVFYILLVADLHVTRDNFLDKNTILISKLYKNFYLFIYLQFYHVFHNLVYNILYHYHIFIG